MPGKARPGKQKTHSGASKRVKRTASGQLRTGKAATSHLFFGKKSRQTKLTKQGVAMSTGDQKRMKKVLISK